MVSKLITLSRGIPRFKSAEEIREFSLGRSWPLTELVLDVECEGNKPARQIATLPMGHYEEMAHILVAGNLHQVLRERGYNGSSVYAVYNVPNFFRFVESGELDLAAVCGIEGTSEKGLKASRIEEIKKACAEAGVRVPKILNAAYMLFGGGTEAEREQTKDRIEREFLL